MFVVGLPPRLVALMVQFPKPGLHFAVVIGIVGTDLADLTVPVTRPDVHRPNVVRIIRVTTARAGKTFAIPIAFVEIRTFGTYLAGVVRFHLLKGNAVPVQLLHELL